MKRILPIIILISLAVLLATACSDDSSSSSVSDETGSIKVSINYGAQAAASARSDATLDSTTETYLLMRSYDLYWTYTAVKTDKGLTTGQVTEATPLVTELDEDGNEVPAKGVPDEAFGDFSYGSWEFVFEAYYLDDDGNAVDYYIGTVTDCTISSLTNTLDVYVTLAEAASDYGQLLIYDIVGFEKDAEVTEENAIDLTEASNYYLYYLIDGDDSVSDSLEWTEDSSKAMASSEGLLIINLDPGYHSLMVYQVKTYDSVSDEDIVASAYVEDGVLIRAGVTTTVNGYLREGVTAAATIEVITNFYYDGTEYSSETVYPVSYTAADGAVDFGTLLLRSSKVTMTVTDEDGNETKTTYTIYSGRNFEYTVSVGYGTVTYLITLGSGTDYTYTTPIIEEVYVASDGAAVSDDVTVFYGNAAAVGADATSTQTVTDHVFYYDVASGLGAVTYKVILDSSDYTYTTELAYYTYGASDGAEDIGDIKLEDGIATVGDDADGTAVTASDDVYTFTYTYVTDAGEAMYIITLYPETLGYSTEEISKTYTASDNSAKDLGTLVIETDNGIMTASFNGGAVFEITLDDGSFSYEYSQDEGVITYNVTLNSDFTYTTSVAAATYTESSSSSVTGLGDVVVADGSVTVGGNEAELDGTAVTYTVVRTGTATYSITLLSNYTYLAVVDNILYLQGDEAADIGTVTLSGSAAAVSIDSAGEYTVTDGAFSFEDTFSWEGSVTYTVTLDDEDYTYATEITAESYAGDLGALTVEDGSAYIGNTEVTGSGLSWTYTDSSYAGSVTYTITLDQSDYSYSYEVASAEYVADGAAADLGTITVADGEAMIDSSVIDLDSYTVTKTGSVTYRITLNDDYSYSTEILSESYSGTLGTIVVEDGLAVVGSFSGTASITGLSFTFVDSETYSTGGTVTYSIILEQEGYTYTAEIISEAYEGSLGTITVADDEASIDGNVIDLDSFTVTAESGGSVTYSITLNDDHSYTATATSRTYVESTSVGLGDIAIVIGDSTTGTIGEASLGTIESDTFTYAPDEEKGPVYTIVLDDDYCVYSAAADSTVYLFSSGYDFGTLTLTSSSASFSGGCTARLVNGTVYAVVGYDNGGSKTYLITLADSYSYSSSLSSTSYAYGSGKSLGSITVEDGYAAVSGESYLVTDGSFTCTVDSVAYTVTLDDESCSYSAEATGGEE